MIARLWQNPLSRFLLVGSIGYLSWYALYEYYLRPHSVADRWVIHQIVLGTETLLSLLQYDLIPYTRSEFMNRVGIEGSLGVTVGAPCDGMILFGLFAAFIVAYPGPIKHKLWFLPVGIVSIHLINVARVAALAIIVDINPEWLDFNHDYTFTILVYGFVFLLWYLWVQKFAPRSKGGQTQARIHSVE